MSNPELDLAFKFVQFTNRNLFLTGKAGTGKTTFLHKLREISPKRMVVVAPTGVAAINAGGVTIHSFFQLPFGPILPGRLDARERSEDRNQSFQRFNKKKINIIRTLDLLVIDEISMVRADMLDGIDHVMRRFKDRRKPFGGAQLLMIGDLQQLAPVVKDNEWNLLREHYETFYFFSSRAFIQSKVVSIELKHVYRQQDSRFIKILNEIRDDRLSPESVEELNKRYKPGFSPDNEEGYITLTTHNAIANRINNQQLLKLNTKAFTYDAEVSGRFPDMSYPADEHLELKAGAQVMFIKNDSSPEKRYFNGKIGRITEIDEEGIFVQCPGEDFPIEVEPETWENVQYSINSSTKEIEEEVAGKFTQYPLRLAWAITIHKSQGLTFEKAVIDAQAAFAHGQTYVALSRCKSLEGLVLSTQVTDQGIICDPTVGLFNSDVEANQPDEAGLKLAQKDYLVELFAELFNFRQLQYYVEKGLKISSENERKLLGNATATFKHMLERGTRPLLVVEPKFIGQLRFLASKPDEEEHFYDRVKKGATYFLEETKKHIEAPYHQLDFNTDNREIGKMLQETLDTIYELMSVKIRCLDYCQKKFVLKDYLKLRALAVLEPAKTEKKKTVRVQVSQSEHPALFERLRSWRHKIAEENQLSHFQILSQKAVLGISNTLPGNSHQLLEVKGIGRKKLEQYGAEILEIVAAYCNENDLAATIALPAVKTKKQGTKEITLEMFREGKTIDQIAEERQFTISTIEGHIAHFIGTGELSIRQFMDERTRAVIISHFYENPDSSLSEAKAALDDSITYGQLRMVKQHLKYVRENTD
ncbi:MAG: helix-turn-helix domain-containing protein [Bacteroidales bacterium]|nr:helix-turn-helix domain-containing protein [Bacteroidales bacterium]